jgi:hypothetical protein
MSGKEQYRRRTGASRRPHPCEESGGTGKPVSIIVLRHPGERWDDG